MRANEKNLNSRNKMLKNSLPGFVIPFEYYRILVLFLLLVIQAESSADICKNNIPCQRRGGCFPTRKSTSNMLLTKCVCVKGYSGRWCQFKEDGIKVDYSKLKGRPGIPKIITNLSAISYEQRFQLTWRKPNSITPIVYYALRYRRVGELSWNNVDEIFSNGNLLKLRETFSYEFKSLLWGLRYEFEIYAGSYYGVGRPAKGIIHRPKIEYPEFTYISEDHIGDKTILENTLFYLHCDARGQPPPLIFWYKDHKRISHRNYLLVKDGRRLGVFKAKYGRDDGYYRCKASNTWGTVMSREVKVVITAPIEFYRSKYENTTTFCNFEEAASFHCPTYYPSTKNGVSFKWGNRYSNSTNNFDIEPNERIWVSNNGTLVFSVFKPQDFALINKKGIRCIIEQKTSNNRRRTIMSLSFQVRLKFQIPWSNWISFFDKPPKKIILLRGENLALTCSAAGFLLGRPEKKKIVHWSIPNRNLRFPNGVKLGDFGRVLKYENVQKSDSGIITCFVYENKEKTVTLLEVLDRPEDVLQNLPRLITVYSSSALRLGGFKPTIQWLFNGMNLKVGGTEYYDLVNVSTKDTGVYQVDMFFTKKRYTTTIYLYVIDEKELDKTVPANSAVHLHCLPQGTFSSSEVNVNFSVSCGSNVVNNTFTVTQETAWKHSLCSCNARGNHYSVKRKFDLGFEGALFSTTTSSKWVWSSWSSWSFCPLFEDFCGRNLLSTRHRECRNENNLTFFDDGYELSGEYCSGSWKQKRPCPFVPCPKKDKGRWSIWSRWNKCSKSCGFGSRMRQRLCSKKYCLGSSKQYSRCYTKCKEGPTKKIYSGIFFLPNLMAFGAAVILVVVAIAMAVHNLRKKSMKKSKHRRLLQDLFKKPDLEVERQPLLETEVRPPPARKQPPSRKHRKQNLESTEPMSEPKSVARFKHKTDTKLKKKRDPPPDGSSSSLAPAIPPGSLPPPSPSLLAPSGGIAPAPSAGGIPPPPPGVETPGAPISSSGSVGPPPPPPPPPPAPKR